MGQRIYLDTSVYNRPFDDQTQPRIWLETLAFAVILQMVESGSLELVSSSVLEYENSRNPFPLRREWVNRCLKLASHHQAVDEEIKRRAQELEQQGLKAVDALHVACAEAAGAVYFLTCDDRVVRRYRDKELQVLNPIIFVMLITGGKG
jgi:predicted nucleic acid-binding protein